MTEDERASGAGSARPTAAGMYDHYLGGTNNTLAEREAGDRIRAVMPDLEATVWANRSFHQRAARWLAEQGIRQFIDLGAGLPTQENTHQVVQRVAPDARVVYVDIESRTAELGEQLVAESENTTFVLADARDMDAVLGGAGELLDLTRPVGLVATALIHFISDDDDPWGLFAKYMQQLAPGSYLALSHITADRLPREPVRTILDIYRSAGEMVYFRNREQVEWLFEGLELVPPYEGADRKVTYMGLWGCEDPVAADDDTGRWCYVGVARRP